jgi:hypothetical protein
MTDADLDSLYADLCRTMTRLGEPQMQLYLARFALLAMTEIDDAAKVARLIAAAADGLDAAEPPHAAPDPP